MTWLVYIGKFVPRVISYLNMQKKIREWIKNLPYGCPPDEEVQEMRKEILDGRSKHIKP